MQSKNPPPIVAGSCWRHNNGFTYIVLVIGNDYPDPKPAYPPTVIYCNRGGKLHTVRADDWHRRMELIEPDNGLALAALDACRVMMKAIENGA